MKPTELIEFSNKVEANYSTVEAYVLHVRAHHRQVGDGDPIVQPCISFAEFKDQEDALLDAGAQAG